MNVAPMSAESQLGEAHLHPHHYFLKPPPHPPLPHLLLNRPLLLPPLHPLHARLQVAREPTGPFQSPFGCMRRYTAHSLLITLILTNIRQDDIPAMQSRAFADEGLLLKLGKFTAELRMAGLNILTSKIEVFFRGNWTAINADSPFPVKKGSVIALRCKGVTRMLNWEIDSKFIENS